MSQVNWIRERTVLKVILALLTISEALDPVDFDILIQLDSFNFYFNHTSLVLHSTPCKVPFPYSHAVNLENDSVEPSDRDKFEIFQTNFTAWQDQISIELFILLHLQNLKNIPRLHQIELKLDKSVLVYCSFAYAHVEYVRLIEVQIFWIV